MANVFPGLNPERVKKEPFYNTLAALQRKGSEAKPHLLQNGIDQLNAYMDKLAKDGKESDWNDKGAFVFREGTNFVDTYAPRFVDHILQSGNANKLVNAPEFHQAFENLLRFTLEDAPKNVRDDATYLTLFGKLNEAAKKQKPAYRAESQKKLFGALIIQWRNMSKTPNLQKRNLRIFSSFLEKMFEKDVPMARSAVREVHGQADTLISTPTLIRSISNRLQHDGSLDQDEKGRIHTLLTDAGPDVKTSLSWLEQRHGELDASDPKKEEFGKIVALAKFMVSPRKADPTIAKNAKEIAAQMMKRKEEDLDGPDHYSGQKPNPEIPAVVKAARSVAEAWHMHRQTGNPRYLLKILQYLQNERVFGQDTYKSIIKDLSDNRYSDAASKLNEAYANAYAIRFSDPRKFERIHEYAASGFLSDILGYAGTYLHAPDKHASDRLMKYQEQGKDIARRLDEDPAPIIKTRIARTVECDLRALAKEYRQKFGRTPILMPDKVLYTNGRVYRVLRSKNNHITSATPIPMPRQYDLASRTELENKILEMERVAHAKKLGLFQLHKVAEKQERRQQRR